jgi:hypothetical protein
MKLVYDDTGRCVMEGDKVKTFRGDLCEIVSFVKPHNSSSTGLVYVKKNNMVSGFYPSVVGATWID